MRERAAGFRVRRGSRIGSVPDQRPPWRRLQRLVQLVHVRFQLLQTIGTPARRAAIGSSDGMATSLASLACISGKQRQAPCLLCRLGRRLGRIIVLSARVRADALANILRQLDLAGASSTPARAPLPRVRERRRSPPLDEIAGLRGAAHARHRAARSPRRCASTPHTRDWPRGPSPAGHRDHADRSCVVYGVRRHDAGRASSRRCRARLPARHAWPAGRPSARVGRKSPRYAAPPRIPRPTCALTAAYRQPLLCGQFGREDHPRQ